jgi:hypothetical protein
LQQFLHIPRANPVQNQFLLAGIIISFKKAVMDIWSSCRGYAALSNAASHVLFSITASHY